jgi:TetR/AcrR family tetracycline transcriptional repressor
VAKVALTRTDIVAAALDLLDEAGLDGLTLRALADRLGVSAPTLYWHVTNKRHLLDLMAEAIVRDTAGPDIDAPAPGQPWWEWLAERCRHMRRALLARRDAALVVAGNRPTPELAPHVERTLGALVDIGLTPGEALRTLLALGTYTTGDALETQRSLGRDPAADAEVHATLDQVIGSGDFPLMAAAGEALGDEDERFEEGLALMIDGVRARVDARTARRQRPGAGAPTAAST